MSSSATRQRALPALRIRPACAADAGILCAAEREAARIPGRLLSQPDELQPGDFSRKIAELEKAGSYLVADRDGVIVAHGLLEPAGALAALAHVRTLTIVVHAGHTGQGIGAVLLHALLDWARSNPGVERVELRVRESNAAAIHLYKKCGFAAEARFRKRVKLADGTHLDDIGMTWFRPSANGSGP